MRRLVLVAFIGTFLLRDVTLSKVHRNPSNLEWLFGLKKLSDDNKEEKRTVCETAECKKMAGMLLGSMNTSVNPCDDFYEYACGKWSQVFPIPSGVDKWDMMHTIFAKTIQQVADIVKSKPADNDLKPVKFAKKWFKACMDADAIKKQGIDPLVFTLSRLGGWPMIMEPDKWDEQEYNWQRVDDQYMRLTGRNALYDVRIQKDDSNVVEIDTPHLPPGSEQLHSSIESDSEEDYEEENEDKEEEGDSKSDEDPSDEEKQSEEEPGSESRDDDDEDVSDGSGDDDNNNDNDDDNDDDDDNNDNTNEQDEDIKKKIGKKKLTGKIDHRRNKKLRHVRQRKSGTQIIKKHDSHIMKRQRIRRRATAEVDNKRTQRFNRHEKLYAREGKKNHVRKVHSKRTKKLLDNEKMTFTTTKPEDSAEEMNEDNEDEQALVQQYADYISKVARVIAKEGGTEISEERLKKDILDMIKFQLRLIQISSDDSIFDTNEEVTLGGFQERYNAKNPKTARSKIDWINKIKALFDEADESVDNDLKLDIKSSNYIEELLSLLDETSNRTIVNYLHWNFISKIIKTTTSEMEDLHNSWEEASKGRNPRPRFNMCMQSREIKEILAYEFVRKYFSDDIIKTASSMISDMQKEVEKLIKRSSWMDDEAKDFALAKVENLKRFIGYPKWYKNTTIIEEYYEGLVIGSSYYENVVRYDKWSKQKNLQKLSKNNEARETEEESRLEPTEVNAFYMPWRNAIVFPAADFQSPWYSSDRPRFVNFGTMGFIMAHEVNHGFDDTGHKYDKNGDFLGWFSSMADQYDKKEDCFIQQFNNYSIDEKTNEKIKDYGEQTTSDNIADTMGLQTVYKAYQSKEKESETPDATLPGMEDFTNDQLLFLSFANLWCESYSPNMMMTLAKIDDHSIGRLRIIGSVSNSDDFARAYNCPVGSPMNPEKKCNIWN